MDRFTARKIAKSMIVEGKTQCDSLREQKFAESTVLKRSTEIVNHPLVQEEIRNVRAEIAASAKKYDLTTDRLVKKASEGLEAKRTISALLLSGNEESESGKKNFQPIEVDDHDAQIKWWDRAAFLLGLKKDDDGNGHNIVNINQLFMLVQQSRQERGLPVEPR